MEEPAATAKYIFRCMRRGKSIHVCGKERDGALPCPNPLAKHGRMDAPSIPSPKERGEDGKVILKEIPRQTFGALGEMVESGAAKKWKKKKKKAPLEIKICGEGRDGGGGGGGPVGRVREKASSSERKNSLHFPTQKKAGRREKESREEGEGEKKMKPKCEEEALLCLGREQCVLYLSLCRKRLKIRGSVQRKKKWEMETAAAASCGKTERVCVCWEQFSFILHFFFSFWQRAC